MRRIQRKPTSPGEILSEEFLKPLGITQKELAEHLHCDYKVINRIVNEKASVTPQMATRLAAAFETTPDFWMNAQIACDLWGIRPEQRRISSLIRRRSKSNKF
ncbi:MAG TPA: HigA family addiction module antitoxin [Rhabdochlamydiaceae bacterium]|nr:HigA family addiction module antitoxin [Rhabdochlamydiaceae bacterium]